MIQALLRIIAYGISGFRRNIWLSVIAIITMTMTLLTLTAFALGDRIISKQYQQFSQENIDYAIFLKDSAADTDITQLRTQIDAHTGIVSSEFISKEEARLRFEKLFGDDPELKGVISDENNPLPREITVKFEDPKFIDPFNDFIQEDRFKEIVEKTSYQRNQAVIDNYLRTTGFLKIFGIALSLFFTLVAILVLLNTIRLTIYSRRTEVEVMRFVGATQGYIRGPFIVEGIIFGLISAIIAAMLSWLFLNQLETLIEQSFAAGNVNFITDLFADTLRVGNQSAVSSVLTTLFLLQLGVGLLLGIACSIFAIRRYLKEQ
ncbi:MAG TPA: permease-like cell division protein FtsX [Verrucomicrobiae bacterium]|nr:permease-like cell division protein FtsX [Verrucomicrobiae bacterium]